MKNDSGKKGSEKAEKQIFGYLSYRLQPVAGGPGLTTMIEIDSLENANKVRDAKLKLDSQSVVHKDFKVLSHDKKVVLWDYSKPPDKQLRPLNTKRIINETPPSKGLTK